MPLRAFPVLYAKDVETVAGFYAALGFEEHVRMRARTAARGSSGRAATAPSGP